MDEGKDTFRRSDWQPVDGKQAGLARITVLSGPSGPGTKNMRLDADPNAVTYRELQALPTDPDALYRKIWADTDGQGPTHEEAALEAIGAMLDKASLLPEVGAALYRAAARVPGVSVVKHAKDAAGRRGIGLALGSGDGRDVWVLNSASTRSSRSGIPSPSRFAARSGLCPSTSGTPHWSRTAPCGPARRSRS
jgi:hypothetical protein